MRNNTMFPFTTILKPTNAYQAGLIMTWVRNSAGMENIDWAKDINVDGDDIQITLHFLSGTTAALAQLTYDGYSNLDP